jgi:filamentous hemagglutinin family protein
MRTIFWIDQFCELKNQDSTRSISNSIQKSLVLPLIKSTIYLSFLSLTGIINATSVHSQTYQPSNRTPIADNTLSTQVSGANNNFTVTGGLSRGGNLFHSFTDFSLPTNGSVTFSNPAADRSVITRVTGNLFSDLNGRIDTNGANFFLINPNGIVFGNNVQLNVGKLFVGSTANSIDLVDSQGRAYTFGTKNINDAPLLTVAPNVVFNPARLIIAGSGTKGIESYGNLETINQGQYIGLIGGNINFNGGKVNAPGGRIELGGLSAPGIVDLETEGNRLRARFPIDVGRGDISFSNQSRVLVSGSGGGDIAISARNLELLGGSVISGGIEEGLGAPQAVSGDIKVNATGDILLSGTDTAIVNKVRLNSQGNAGNISIDAGSLSIQDAVVESSTFGMGNSGNVIVIAKNTVSLKNSIILSKLENGGIGKGGNINIDAGSVSLQDGAQLTASSFGQGNAGNITIKVTGTVDIAGTKDGFPSAIYSTLENGGIGKGGNINIDAGSVSLQNGAQLIASTFGTGNAGNVTVITKDAVFLKDSIILSTVERTAVGNGGDIVINANTLSLQDGAQLQSSTFKASDTQLTGKRNAGNITIKVNGAINISGVKDGFLSAIFTRTETGGEGNGGNITINAGSLSFRDAVLEASTFGMGNAGNIKVTAKDTVSLENSSILSAVETGAVGNGGDITINTGSIFLRDGSVLSSSTGGIGNAGNVTVIAKDVFFFVDSKILSTVDTLAKGHGGNINIDAGSFSLRGDAQVATSIFGQGDSGSITIKVPGTVDIAGTKNGFPSAIYSLVDTLAKGHGGNINIDAGSFSLRDGAQVAASTFGIGNAGNITLIAKDAVFLVGDNSIIFSTAGNGGLGHGGNINIHAGSFSLQDGAQVAASSVELGSKAGEISLVSNLITLNNGIISSVANSSTGGNINLTTSDRLLLQNGSNISTNSTSNLNDGNGGNITINSPVIIATQRNNDISANALAGSGGKVNITSQGLFGIQFRTKGQNSPLSNDITASSTFGQNGTVKVNTPGIDPGQDANQLPAVPTDTSNQISQTCSPDKRDSNFTVTGRGGLPKNARDLLANDVLWQDPRATDNRTTAKIDRPQHLHPAVGWVLDGKGKVTLISAEYQVQPIVAKQDCQHRERQ